MVYISDIYILAHTPELVKGNFQVGMPPAAVFSVLPEKTPRYTKSLPGRSGGDGCAQNHVLVREKRNSSQRVMRTCTAAQTTKIRLRFGMGMGIDR